MSRRSGEQLVAQELGQLTGTRGQDWFPVFKARYGMQVVFTAIRERLGDGNVVTQSFTCATAVNPILAAGLTPRYADISANTYAIDPDRLEVSEHDRAVVIQHTFGIVNEGTSTRLREKTLAASVNALVVEDSAHAVGHLARDAAGMPVADVSVHSWGAEKLLPSKFGGAIWVNPEMKDVRLRAAIVEALSNLPVPGRRLDKATRAYRNQLRVLTRLPSGIESRVRGFLERRGRFEPPVARSERRGTMPHEPMRATDWILSQMVQGLRDLDDHQARRCAATEAYRVALDGVVQYPGSIRENLQPLVRFPISMPSAEAATKLITALQREKVYVGSWYRPGLFPGVDTPETYHFDETAPELATTAHLTATVVNLPTRVSPDEARRIAELVREHLDVTDRTGSAS